MYKIECENLTKDQIVKNVLNFDNDLKPILNDMEYVMDRLIHKFSPKKKYQKL